MPSQPDEKPQEDVRTALTILKTAGQRYGDYGWTFLVMDLEAIQARLEAALVKIADLEGLAIGRREHELAIMLDRAEYIAREFPPLDYPVAEDRALLGQQVDEDGE